MGRGPRDERHVECPALRSLQRARGGRERVAHADLVDAQVLECRDAGGRCPLHTARRQGRGRREAAVVPDAHDYDARERRGHVPVDVEDRHLHGGRDRLVYLCIGRLHREHQVVGGARVDGERRAHLVR